jgi:hypothetical protein
VLVCMCVFVYVCVYVCVVVGGDACCHTSPPGAHLLVQAATSRSDGAFLEAPRFPDGITFTTFKAGSGVMLPLTQAPSKVIGAGLVHEVCAC